VLELEYGMTIFKIVSKVKNEKKSMHGGARPGAGRPLGHTKTKITVSLNESAVIKARSLWHQPFSNLVEMLLDRYVTNPINSMEG
jgi:hypothetical protein